MSADEIYAMLRASNMCVHDIYKVHTAFTDLRAENALHVQQMAEFAERAGSDMNALRAENARLRELLKECADDMEAEYKAKYGFVEGDLPHPVERRLYERDMVLVRAARAAMGESDG